MLYSRFSLVIYFIHSIYMSIPVSRFISPPPLSPPWCPYICSLHLCLYFCFANKIIYTFFFFFIFHIYALIYIRAFLWAWHTLCTPGDSLRTSSNSVTPDSLPHPQQHPRALCQGPLTSHIAGRAPTHSNAHPSAFCNTRGSWANVWNRGPAGEGANG